MFPVQDISGIVHFVGRVEEIGNNGFAKRTLVISDEGIPTPSFAVFEAKRGRKKDRTLILDGFRVGDKVTVKYIPDGREWCDQKTGKTRWFGGNVLIDVLPDAAASSSEASDAPAPEPVQDDMPF